MSVQAFRDRKRNDDQFWIDRWPQDAGDATLRKAVDQRTYSRIKIAPASTSEDRAAHPLLVNVSQRGACLWLHESPQIQQYLSLRFRCGGQDHVLRSRVTWVRHYPVASDRVSLPRAEGWLAGIDFAEGNADINTDDIPEDILRTGDVAVDLLGENDNPVERDSSQDEDEKTHGLTTWNDKSADGIKAATRELVPVFARHFSNVRVVITRERLEFSASFRPPEQAKSAQIQQRNHPAIAEKRASPVPATASHEQRATAAQPAKAAVSHRIIAITGVAIVILGATYFGVSRHSDLTSGETMPVLESQSIPVWAQGLALDGVFVDDWMEVKASFDLPDDIMRSAIQILRANDIYPPAHDLHDLTKYPVQAARAFSLLASAQTATGEPFDLGEFEDDLESRLMAGVRFPDEAPGGRYSSLQRELYHNVVVLGVVDLLCRRQYEPGVRDVLAALRRGGPTHADSRH